MQVKDWRRYLLILVGCALASACTKTTVTSAGMSAGLAAFLGDMYYHGWVLPKNGSKAAHWYQVAAVRGNVKAQYVLGCLYFSGTYAGLSGPQAFRQSNPQLAAVWWRKAAVRGNAAAQWSLGVLYQGGAGVSKSYKQALSWYKLAAENRTWPDAEMAQFSVANVYAAGGVSTQPNYQKAALWYRRAAENYGASTGSAMCQLAYLYEHGEGVPRSYPSAYVLYDLAVKYNCPLGESKLKTLAMRMTPAQLAEARDLAATWRVGSPLP